MANIGFVGIALAVYFAVNFLCALVLHIHAEHQAHLRVRPLDVLVHFVLLTALALPVLLVITAEALFGGERKATKHSEVSHARAA